MIHTAKQSAKLTKLVRRIRSALPGLPVDPSTVATGLLEQMWHFTITSAKRGDIGQHDDELIAEACGWLGDPAELVAILVETGWLDECDDHRLVVHDWHIISREYIQSGGRRKDLGTMAWKRMRQRVVEEDGSICVYCGCDCGERFTVDHVVPVARGGTMDRSNLVIACRRCNGRKADK